MLQDLDAKRPELQEIAEQAEGLKKEASNENDKQLITEKGN